MRTRTFEDCNYRGIYFNGKTVRIALDPSKPITELKYPEFLDVKITDFCLGNCPYCYMDSTKEGTHHRNIVQKIYDYFGYLTPNQKPFQVAIGGGEPTSHPEFVDSLEAFHRLGITPNYTTNGMFVESGLGRVHEIISATKEYCGGVAVSCHEHLDLHWTTASHFFAGNDIKLNFHIIISDSDSSDRFRDIYNEFKDMVEYFVLLPYGAQGRAVEKEIDWEYLKTVLPEDQSKIAFGANFHPYLVKDKNEFSVSLYEPESMSKFLDMKDMSLYPSSFMIDMKLN